jgi:hypothetical protein
MDQNAGERPAGRVMGVLEEELSAMLFGFEVEWR